MTQPVGPFTIKVGWDHEPAASGDRNLVTVKVTETSTNKGVAGLAKTLKLTAILGDARKELVLAESDEAPGNYSAAILPSQAGLYVIHLQGDVQGRASLNNDFHVEEVTDGAADAFPAATGQPTPQELQVEIQQLKTELDRIRNQPKSIPGEGLVGAVLALGLVGVALRRKL